MPRRPTPQAIRTLLAVTGERIADSLPPRWRSTVEARTTDGGIVRFVAPDGRAVRVRAVVRKRLDTRAAAQIAFDEPTVVIADWLSPRARIDPRGVRSQLRRHHRQHPRGARRTRARHPSHRSSEQPGTAHPTEGQSPRPSSMGGRAHARRGAAAVHAHRACPPRSLSTPATSHGC